ncbi:MAG: MarR family transcriptional regulator [Clostridium baratii]|uniref:MarR family winged helix-turn-helix transcriptional regulator n=1 Tax=Clostridium baratii TaxID=1561 RepID=UPI00242FB620|nr:MarR family transcriptional regulator [Clostridium baratii]MBS6007336.1 MarR family transcriptional regulator [Clostridium baratii]MDU1054960.1 MarR family transcriptional regulator [Clostridium baratii]
MNELIKWISIADRHSKIYLDKKLKEIGLNSSQHFYIIKIFENPGITQDKIMDSIHLNPSNITRALCQLEKLKFIERVPKKEDKRTYNLYLTDKGAEVYPLVIKIIDDWCKEILRGFSEEESICLLRLIEKVANNSLVATEL